MRLLGTRLLVRLTLVPERSAGGVYLPETLRQQWTDGTVVGAGPGWRVPGQLDLRSVMWASEGDRVLFPKSAFEMIDAGSRLGSVREEEVMGLIDADGDLTPLNEWILLRPPEREESRGVLAVPDRYRKRPDHAIVLRYGPGVLQKRGDLAGTRTPVHETWGLAREDIEGMTVYLEAEADVMEVGRVAVDRWLVRASQCCACE